MAGTGDTDSRQPVPVDTGQGLTVQYLDRWLYSRREPMKNPVRAASTLVIKSETLVFCPSPLLGYGLQELLQRLPERCAVLAVEADERLMAFSLRHIPDDVRKDPRFRYVRTTAAFRVLELFDTLPNAPYRRVARLDLSGGAALFSEFYGDTLSALDEYVSRWWKNRFTLMRLGRNYARNILTNLGLAKAAIPFSIPANKAIYLAGAGPSLEAALPALLQHRERLFVAAVDTAARLLADSGIRPDALILVESQYWIDPAFHGLSRGGIPVWADLTARTASVLRTGGPISFFVSEYTTNALLRRLHASGSGPVAVPPLGSVGLTALYLLSQIGTGEAPIFFSGLDFSWERGFTHNRSAPAALEALDRANRMRPLPLQGLPGTGNAVTVSGRTGPVVTTPLLEDYAAQARALAARIAATRRGPCVDLGQTGLDTGFIPGDPGVLGRHLEAFAKVVGKSEIDGDRETLGQDGLNGADLSCFLLGESQKIERLETMISDFLRGENTDRESLREAMREMDYLWLHFPDAARGYAEENDFMERTLAGTGYFKKSIARALSFLSS